ncbi:hypothetical protein [Vibrio vulnificus]
MNKDMPTIYFVIERGKLGRLSLTVPELPTILYFVGRITYLNQR